MVDWILFLVSVVEHMKVAYQYLFWVYYADPWFEHTSIFGFIKQTLHNDLLSIIVNSNFMGAKLYLFYVLSLLHRH